MLRIGVGVGGVTAQQKEHTHKNTKMKTNIKYVKMYKETWQ